MAHDPTVVEAFGLRAVVEPNGARRSQLTVWQGLDRLALDRTDIISETARSKVAGRVVEEAERRGLSVERADVDRLLADAAARVINASGAEEAEAEGEASYPDVTFGGPVVDIVRTGDRLAWLVADDEGVRIEPEWDGRRPWPEQAIPWPAIPDARTVEAVDGLPPIAELAEFISGRARLPRPADVWAFVLAAWSLGTYHLDAFTYYPLVLLEGPPERGKTRTQKAVGWPAFRGVYTPSPTEASIFRFRARHRVTLMVDVEDLPRRLESAGFGDVLLNGFEAGGTVPRVVRPDAPPVRQIEHFPVYGATILVTNRPIPDSSPLASRCLRLALPEAGSLEVPDAARPEDVAELRARAVAWAARMRSEGRTLPHVEVPLMGRARDLARPILRVLAATAPETLDPALDLFRELDAGRRAEMARTWEARVALALWDSRDRVEAGRLYIRDLAAVVNDGVGESETLTNQQVGIARRNLGLQGGAGGAEKLAFVRWPGDDVVEALWSRYTAPEKPPVSPACPVARPATGFSARETSRATPGDPGETREASRKVSRPRNPHHDYDAGDTGDTGDLFSPGEMMSGSGPGLERDVPPPEGGDL